MTYKCGIKPEIGDIIECVNTSNKSGYHISTLKPNTNYKVISVVHLTGGTLVKIKDKYGVKREYSSSRFKLISRYGKQVKEDVKIVPQYIIVGPNRKIAKAGNDDLNQQLQILLKANPYITYHIFEYKHSAKTKEPQIEYFDKNKTYENSDIVEYNKSKRTPSQDIMFRKK